jgi:hypothetical protein
MRTKTTAEALEIPDDFAPLVAAFGRDPEVLVERGWGAGNIILKVGGKIFVMSMRGDLVAKLPKKRVDALVDDDLGVRFDPRRDGRMMNEWVVVGPDAADWVSLAREALAFVRAGGTPVKGAKAKAKAAAAKAVESAPPAVPASLPPATAKTKAAKTATAAPAAPGKASPKSPKTAMATATTAAKPAAKPAKAPAKPARKG